MLDLDKISAKLTQKSLRHRICHLRLLQLGKGFINPQRAFPHLLFLKFCFAFLSRFPQPQLLCRICDTPEGAAGWPRTRNAISKCDPNIYFSADGILQVQSWAPSIIPELNFGLIYKIIFIPTPLDTCNNNIFPSPYTDLIWLCTAALVESCLVAMFQKPESNFPEWNKISYWGKDNPLFQGQCFHILGNGSRIQ